MSSVAESQLPERQEQDRERQRAGEAGAPLRRAGRRRLGQEDHLPQVHLDRHCGVGEDVRGVRGTDARSPPRRDPLTYLGAQVTADAAERARENRATAEQISARLRASGNPLADDPAVVRFWARWVCGECGRWRGNKSVAWFALLAEENLCACSLLKETPNG